MTAEIVKLEPSDLDGLDEFQKRPSSIKKLRDHHHLVARLVAEGRRTTDIAAEVGLSISRVSILKADPAFQQLIEFYRANYNNARETAFFDTQRKWALLESNALDHINDIYEEDPNSISLGEARADAELASDRQGRKINRNLNVNVTEGLAERVKRVTAQLSAPPSAEEPGLESLPASPVPAQDLPE